MKLFAFIFANLYIQVTNSNIQISKNKKLIFKKEKKWQFRAAVSLDHECLTQIVHNIKVQLKQIQYLLSFTISLSCTFQYRKVDFVFLQYHSIS